MLAIACVASFFLPEEKLRTVSGLQAQQASQNGGAIPAGPGAATGPGGTGVPRPTGTTDPEPHPVTRP